MRVYTKIVIDMETGGTIASEWTEYTGPIGGCKGGEEPKVDEEFNARMADISQAQQDISDTMFNYYQFGVDYDPNQKIKSSEWKKWKDNGKRGPEPDKYSGTVGEREGYDPDAQVSDLELEQQQNLAQSELIPLELQSEKERFEQAGERRGLVTDIYKQALEGVDVEGRVSQHRAGVEQQFEQQGEIAARGLSRYGIDPGSGRGQAATHGVGIEKAKAKAFGETAIRSAADTENFNRKTAASGIGI
jgi:hypothetical protein